MGVRAALGAGLALFALALALVLSGSPARVAHTNALTPQEVVGYLHARASACQGEETLPRGTSALRLGLDAAIGPSLAVTVFSRGRVLTRGTRASAWTGADVTVPVARVPQTVRSATICIAFGPTRETLHVFGERSPAAAAVRSSEGTLLGRMVVEDLAPGRRSWWSLALPVARRLGLGRAPSGTWVALLAAALMAAAAALASRLCLRAPTARAAWVCALVALLNAACWSILSPPFQARDEPAHFAYVQQLAETGELPASDSEQYSPQEQAALEGLRFNYVRFRPGAHTISSRAEQQSLERDLDEPLGRTGSGGAGTAAGEPPLYYALETIPYELGAGGTLLSQLELMRLLTALFAALAALFSFLFVRETLPRHPWAWTVGGLGVALAPLLGSVSGAVNPEAMVVAAAAALLYLLARGYRQGLSARLAVAIGVTAAVGLLTKLTFLGLLPGVVLGLLVLVHRAPSELRRATRVALAGVLVLVIAPALLYVLSNRQGGNLPVSPLSSTGAQAGQAGSLLGELSYIWQFYLPRLPGMTSYFPGVFTTRQLWFNGVVGLYGWADTVFPEWVYVLALVPAAVLALLCLRALAGARGRLRGHASEILVYAIIAIGLLAVVGAASYSAQVLSHERPFKDPRYLLQMIPLLGVALALAARGAGRRWGPAVGVLIVVLVLAHDVFSQLLLVARYYG